MNVFQNFRCNIKEREIIVLFCTCMPIFDKLITVIFEEKMAQQRFRQNIGKISKIIDYPDENDLKLVYLKFFVVVRK